MKAAGEAAMPATAMLLAAGRGERMGPLTERRPKPLLSVGGETLIERHLRRLADAGVEQVVINLSYRGDDVRAAVGGTSAWGQTIVYSDEGEPPLETAGGIIQALPLLGSAPFILVSADIVTDFDFRALAGLRAGCLVLVPNPAHHPGGDFGLAPGGALTHRSPHLTYGGIALLDSTLFEGLPVGVRPLRPVFDAAIDQGLLRGIRFGGLWKDVGTPRRLAEARAALG
ncbi:MAG: nucleotidyltransferase family protein [Rhodospirillaceae bacterium]|nr:nucleotidyltransferase family protein [Rhodospirillaceae bacterium]